jgi:hypothetical protein
MGGADRLKNMLNFELLAPKNFLTHANAIKKRI